jgi:hypothetical protein
VAFLDLAKAFDRVPHKLLLHKLKSFGFSGSLLKWFTDYLHHRKQRVILEGFVSKSSVVTSGVPQGSILGPLLFLYYINDMFKYINCNKSTLYLYADDAKIGHVINSTIDCENFQADINRLDSWSAVWGMLFNTNKCVIMSFFKNKSIAYPYMINNCLLEKVVNFCDLGVSVNNKLTWDEHISTCIKRANMRLGLIKRTTGYSCSTKVKLLCYTTLVRPILESCSQVWSNNSKKLIKNLESVQRRATMYIMSDSVSSYKERLLSLDLLPLSYRRDYLDLLFYYNSINDRIDINMLHLPSFVHADNPRTRLNHDDKLLPVTIRKYNVYQGFYQNRIVQLWNTLPYEIRDLEITPNGYNSPFKMGLKHWYMERLFTVFNSDDICTWLTTCSCFKCRP